MKDYLTLFSAWLDRQFVHQDEELHKEYILAIVAEKYITDDEKATYWGKFDCLTMWRLANKDVSKKIWNIKG